jgi:hypothetical protein
VLIETGPIQGDAPEATLVRLNFVAIVTALDALASGRVEAADPARYQSILENESRLVHTLVTNATVIAGTGVAPFTGDIAIAANRLVRDVNGTRTLSWTARIEDLGDLQVYGALRTIDATGLVAAPLFADTLREGAEITLPDWSTWKGATLTVGAVGALVLLEPLQDRPSRYIVRQIVRP